MNFTSQLDGLGVSKAEISSWTDELENAFGISIPISDGPGPIALVNGASSTVAAKDVINIIYQGVGQLADSKEKALEIAGDNPDMQGFAAEKALDATRSWMATAVDDLKALGESANDSSLEIANDEELGDDVGLDQPDGMSFAP